MTQPTETRPGCWWFIKAGSLLLLLWAIIGAAKAIGALETAFWEAVAIVLEPMLDWLLWLKTRGIPPILGLLALAVLAQVVCSLWFVLQR